MRFYPPRLKGWYEQLWIYEETENSRVPCYWESIVADAWIFFSLAKRAKNDASGTAFVFVAIHGVNSFVPSKLPRLDLERRKLSRRITAFPRFLSPHSMPRSSEALDTLFQRQFHLAVTKEPFVFGCMIMLSPMHAFAAPVSRACARVPFTRGRDRHKYLTKVRRGRPKDETALRTASAGIILHIFAATGDKRGLRDVSRGSRSGETQGIGCLNVSIVWRRTYRAIMNKRNEAKSLERKYRSSVWSLAIISTVTRWIAMITHIKLNLNIC